jgi:hypothetical protein
VSKFREILQNIRPLAWILRRRGETQAPEASQGRAVPDLTSLREESLTLPRKKARTPLSWQLVEDDQVLARHFAQLRETLYRFNQKHKKGPSQPPPYYWEAGKLAGERSYFYMKRWEDMGLLFEEFGRGWMISRADKIASQSQFMRERSAWDLVLLYQSPEAPGVYRVESELMGEGRVSITLYEDFLMQTLSKGL